MAVRLQIIIEVDQDYADPDHAAGITEEANLRLYGGEGLWLGEIIECERIADAD